MASAVKKPLTWTDATSYFICVRPLPGMWGKVSMEAHVCNMLNVETVPVGMCIFGWNKTDRLLLIYHKLPTGEYEMTKRGLLRPGAYTIPDFSSATPGTMPKITRGSVWAWVNEISTDEA